MEFCSIASGSSGNCIYVGTNETSLLVDAGVSCKRIADGLKSIDVNVAELDGIFITHEHIDHIQGVPILARKYGIDIYGTHDTLKYIYNKEKGNLGESRLIDIAADTDVCIGDVLVHPFSISHDAADPVSYRIESDGKIFAIATDLGCYDDYIVKNMMNADGVYLEANHDYNMLMVGSYPYSLKQRVAGSKGHLSNDAAAELLLRIGSERLKAVLLAHLSKENNYAELAYETVRAELLGKWEYGPIEMTVAPRDIPSALYTI